MIIVLYYHIVLYYRIILSFRSLFVQSGQAYDYCDVLHKSILFFEAERSGELPNDNRIDYRDDSAMGDKGNNNEDLTGGWYDGEFAI